MSTLSQFISKYDSCIDPGLVATLAGLSLAAVAYFIPNSNKILRDANRELQSIEPKIDKSTILMPNAETAYTERKHQLTMIIKSIDDANNGLLKSFFFFSALLIYTITIDQFIDDKSLIDFISFNTQFLQLGDVIASYILLSFAGYNLWKGVNGIRKYLNVNFDDEITQAKKLLIQLEKLKDKK